MSALLIGFLVTALVVLLVLLWVGNLGRSAPGFRLWGWTLLVLATAFAALPMAVARVWAQIGPGFGQRVLWLGLSLLLLASLGLWHLRRLPDTTAAATFGLAACALLAALMALLLRPF